MLSVYIQFKQKFEYIVNTYQTVNSKEIKIQICKMQFLRTGRSTGYKVKK